MTHEEICDQVAGKNTPKRKSAPNRKAPTRPLRSPSNEVEENDEREENEPEPRAKRSAAPVDMSQCRFNIVCITKFSDKEIVPDMRTVKLAEFKVHDYNSKATKAVHKAAEKQKVGYDQEETIATIKALKLTKESKVIEDPLDWKDLKEVIHHHMEQGIKNIRVDYTLTFSKT